MTWELAHIYAVATWPACASIFFIAACRLNAMPRHTRFLVVLEYSIWAGLGFCAPWLPLVGEWPGLGFVLMLYALLVVLLCSARAWAGDRAPEEATDTMPLDALRPRSKFAELVDIIRRA